MSVGARGLGLMMMMMTSRGIEISSPLQVIQLHIENSLEYQILTVSTLTPFSSPMTFT